MTLSDSMHNAPENNDPIFDALNDLQREAVAATEGEVRLVAGADPERRGCSYTDSHIWSTTSESTPPTFSA